MINSDALKLLPFAEQVEIAENVYRDGFTQSELAAVQERLRVLVEKTQAKGAPKGNTNAATNNDGQKSVIESAENNGPQKTPVESEDKKARKTDAIVGGMFGESAATVQRRRAVVEAAEAEPEKFSELVEEMDRTGKVGGVYKRLKQFHPQPAPELPEGTYNLIYADPPWLYHKHCHPTREVSYHYPVMALQDICDLPVADIAADDCVLFMWTTSPKCMEAGQVIESWGFEYKTQAVWVKDKIGMGYYWRQQHELLLLATKGKPGTPNESERVSSIMHAPREEHSKKPDGTYGMIERMYPKAKRIELFARQARDGWDAWGNEVGVQE